MDWRVKPDASTRRACKSMRPATLPIDGTDERRDPKFGRRRTTGPRLLASCVIVSTGCTPAKRANPRIEAPVPALSEHELVAGVQQLAGLAQIEVRRAINVPAVEVGPEHWMALRAEILDALSCEAVCGVVVTHGTDLLEETAWFLALTLPMDRPIVITSAMRNASEIQSSGARNLVDAVRVCLASSARGMGVLVVMDGEIHGAREGERSQTKAKDVFRRGAACELGSVGTDGPAFWRGPRSHPRVEPSATAMPRVDIVPMYGGADGRLVRCAVQEGARGIVIQAVGSGNVSEAMYEELCAAIGAGVQVVIATQMRTGLSEPVYGFPGGCASLNHAGAVLSNSLTPQKARILLMLALQQGWSRSEVQALFDF